MNRRSFLVASALTAAATPSTAPLGANDRLRVAIVGLRGRGGDHIAGFLEQPNVEIAAVCDIDETLLNRRVAQIASRAGRKPAPYTDFRKLLEDSSIDAVSIATPNHHHAIQTIWACQAGKDVYVEKPCS